MTDDSKASSDGRREDGLQRRLVRRLVNAIADRCVLHFRVTHDPALSQRSSFGASLLTYTNYRLASGMARLLPAAVLA
jgi:hypothetical protein